MSFYSSILRPVLFRLSADRSHDLAQFGFRFWWPWALFGRLFRCGQPGLATSIAGIKVANPVGLAPGFDKDGRLLRSLSKLGFGYLVVGSATPQPRPGNPKPRLSRDVERSSIANSMGLPNAGIKSLVEQLKQRPAGSVPVIASIVTFTPFETAAAIADVSPYVDGVEIGLVCPNAEAERMKELDSFIHLARSLPGKGGGVPVFVKLPPVHSPEEGEFVLSVVDACIEYGIAGVSVSGGHSEDVPALAVGRGSIAGARTFSDALRNVRLVADRAGDALPIKASGGIFTAADAAEMMRAGATTVEVYTSFIFRGPNIANTLNRGLVAIMRRRGYSSVSDLVSDDW